MKFIRSLIIILSFFCCNNAISQISGVVNEYRKIIAIDSSKGIIKLSNAGAMVQYIGRTAMIIQMKGATITETNDANFGNISAINQAGHFEFGVICGQHSDTMIFENKFQRFYDPSGFVQLVILPKYTKVTVMDTLKPKAWDPVSGTGGVLAIEASDTVFLNAPMYADSAGFRGGGLLNYPSGNCTDFLPSTDFHMSSAGASGDFKNGAKKGEGIAEYILGKEYAKGKQANGGGGGNNANNGGGGGANYGKGGEGGNKTTSPCVSSNPGVGGKELTTYGYTVSNLKVFMGGGGGAGHENNNVGTPGGHGGGIVYIKCPVLKSSGKTISANGGVPWRPGGLYQNGTAAGGDGGGGGGAGGVVIFNTTNIIGSVILEAKGAKGSNTGADAGACAGPGGGGGGGLIWYSSSGTPAGVSAITTGGSNGLAVIGCNGSTSNANNGATSGNNGTTRTSFALPALRDSSPICKAILPQSIITSFKGHEQNGLRNFVLKIRNALAVQKLMFQRSSDGRNYTDVISVNNNGTDEYNFSDDLSSLNYYRVKVLVLNGGVEFSNVFIFRKPVGHSTLTINPNPVQQRLLFNIKVKERQIVNANIVDQSGRIFTSVRMILHPLVDQYALPLSGLAKGTYQLILAGDKIKLSNRFTKL